eukprot:jgi/Mesen1/5935/ME000301S05059
MWDGNHDNFPPAALITGSAVEVLFGLTGLAVGLAQLVLDAGSPLATAGTIACQMLGWYTFVVYTIAAPAYATRHKGTLYPGLSESQSDFVVAMGIFGGVCYCFALQGSQFFLAFKLHKIQSGKGDLYTPEYYRPRLGMWTGAVLIAGASQTAIGALLRHALGAGRFEAPVVSPPYMVFYPELTITLGCLVTLYGLVGLLFTVGVIPARPSSATGFSLLAAFIFLSHMAFQNLGQSFAGAALVIVNSQLVGLTFSLTYFPAYLVAKLCLRGDMVVPEDGLAV